MDEKLVQETQQVSVKGLFEGVSLARDILSLLYSVVMPRYYEAEEESSGIWRPACSGLRIELQECLAESDCVKKDGHSIKECVMLGKDPSIPNECNVLRNAFFECKRSLLDMRTRFRGRKGY
ncbi:cytochrome c oxidase assembly factor 5-like [Argonauta hians]